MSKILIFFKFTHCIINIDCKLKKILHIKRHDKVSNNSFIYYLAYFIKLPYFFIVYIVDLLLFLNINRYCKTYNTKQSWFLELCSLFEGISYLVRFPLREKAILNTHKKFKKSQNT